MLATLETIIRSPMLETYNIGITVNSKRRKSQYKNFTPTWPHFVVLESGLSDIKALKLEKELFDYLTSDKKSIFYKKYRADSRDNEHVNSRGGLKQGNDRLYDIYIAWANKGDN